MDWSAVFVDAGYLFAAGGSLTCGTPARNRLSCDYPALIDEICNQATSDSGFPVLRVYWYDGAKNAVPTEDHLRISDLSNVKLRLGRLFADGQKGVDSLIVRDLIVLSRDRSIAAAVLLSGDEDVREGLSVAQDMGVKGVLWGIPNPDRPNQAASLVREADSHIVLPKAFWEKFFTRVKEPPGGRHTTPGDLRAVGAEAAEAWFAAGPTEAEVLDLVGGFPVIPPQLDAELLKRARAAFGPSVSEESNRKLLRSAFREAIEDRAKSDNA